MSLAPILYIAFARIDIVPDPKERVGATAEIIGMALITASLGVTAASFYEIYEWVVDHWFGQHLFIGETDTITDLADGFLGAGIGGAFLGLWALARYRPDVFRVGSSGASSTGQRAYLGRAGSAPVARRSALPRRRSRPPRRPPATTRRRGPDRAAHMEPS